MNSFIDCSIYNTFIGIVQIVINKYNNNLKIIVQNLRSMFEHLPSEPSENPKGKTIIVMQNGSPDCLLKMNFIKPITKMDIVQLTQKNWWPNRYRGIRIYGVDAIELFDQDLLYLKNNDRIFVSRGQDFDSNKNFGEYEVIRPLGQGGFGSVSLGVNKITGQKVAIKIVKANKANSSSCIDMIFRQAENLKSLSHPNIVKIINCYTLKNMKFVVVMEYLEGGELKDQLKLKQRFEEEEARIYFKQIIAAVSYCHRQGIVHRDLKLENILLTKQNQVKVADFGISGVADRFNPELDWGTLKYMPPEILSKKEKANAFAGDVWACGVILYNMVQGVLPFSGNSSSQIIQKIINSPVQFSQNVEISNNCKDLIKKMLQKNPKQRIALSQVEDSPWFVRGSEGHFRTETSVILAQSDGIKQSFKPRKVLKKTTIAIPKRLEKQKNQVIEQLQGYRMNRKLYRSQSKCLPQLKTSQNRINRQGQQNFKLSSIELQSNKKSFFRAP